jgi:hypothetical protein
MPLCNIGITCISLARAQTRLIVAMELRLAITHPCASIKTLVEGYFIFMVHLICHSLVLIGITSRFINTFTLFRIRKYTSTSIPNQVPPCIGATMVLESLPLPAPTAPKARPTQVPHPTSSSLPSSQTVIQELAIKVPEVEKAFPIIVTPTLSIFSQPPHDPFPTCPSHSQPVPIPI